MKKFLHNLKEWWYRLFYEEYHVTVWFQKTHRLQGMGVEIIEDQSKTKRVFKMKSISKQTPTHIKGKDLKGRKLEIRTVKPFDYQIRKIY